MHHMDALCELREKLSVELDEIANKGEMSAGDLETVHKLTDTIKNIDKICIMSEDGEYSQAGDWEAMGRTYGRGSSYSQRRDSMGRYSRTGMGGGYSSARGRGGRRGYSRDDAKSKMMEQLEDMMEDASTEKEREAIRRCISQIEKD